MRPLRTYNRRNRNKEHLKIYAKFYYLIGKRKRIPVRFIKCPPLISDDEKADAKAFFDALYYGDPSSTYTGLLNDPSLS